MKRAGWKDTLLNSQPAIDLRAVSSALFLPLLLWTGSVIAISFMGYPGVVCMTPAAWLLALPVGIRVHRESQSPGRGPVVEAALGGALLGLWQALLLAAVIAASPYLPGRITSEPPSPVFAVVLAGVVSMPVTAGLAALIVFWMKRR